MVVTKAPGVKTATVPGRLPDGVASVVVTVAEPAALLLCWPVIVTYWVFKGSKISTVPGVVPEAVAIVVVLVTVPLYNLVVVK